MFTEKKLNKIEKDINESLLIADNRMNKYFNEYKGKEYLPLSIFMGVGRYVRKYPYAENGSLVVANIQIDPRKQGQGYFKQFYKLLEKIANEKNLEIVFESVLSEKLNQFLKREGFSENNGTFFKQYGQGLNNTPLSEKNAILESTKTLANRGIKNGFNC